jgi:hypothetical protein
MYINRVQNIRRIEEKLVEFHYCPSYTVLIIELQWQKCLVSDLNALCYAQKPTMGIIMSCPKRHAA